MSERPLLNRHIKLYSMFEGIAIIRSKSGILIQLANVHLLEGYRRKTLKMLPLHI